jgi:hypothetical protein
MKALQRTLEAWAKEYRATLEPNVKRLVDQANFDLYNGPSGNDDDFPGFTTATRTIADALDDLPSVLYVDLGCEGWQDVEPTWDHDAGVFEEDYCRVERHDLIGALVGRELAEYL